MINILKLFAIYGITIVLSLFIGAFLISSGNFLAGLIYIFIFNCPIKYIGQTGSLICDNSIVSGGLFAIMWAISIVGIFLIGRRILKTLKRVVKV